MQLSTDLLSQFVKVTNDKTKTKNDTITYGTVFKKDDGYYVQLDGSSLTMPVAISQMSSGTMTSVSGSRVIILIKNHTATIIGSLEPEGAKVTTLDGIEVNLKTIADLQADNLKIKETLYAENGVFNTLKVNAEAVFKKLTAGSGKIEDLDAHFIDAVDIAATYATIEQMKATWIKAFSVDATYGDFDDLVAEKVKATFANIDFSNIGKAAIENLFTKSGLIENVIVGDGTITGTLVGVTIRGDTIEGNTVVADKLVIRGEDGLYYKLNTDGVTTESEQTEYNSLNGSIITAKSITATQISVSDLVAFDATIGGFTITENSIHSEVKDSEGNVTRGIYMDTDGQVNFGDASNFIKYYKDEDGSYKLAISAASILYALNGKQYSISDLGKIGEYVHIGTYEDEPCIELGESDSDFKLIITNTRIMFMEGTSVPAYINNQSLHIEKAVIEEELQQGQFVWRVRTNGNMGLMWKGDS